MNNYGCVFMIIENELNMGVMIEMTGKQFTFHHDVDGVDYIKDESNGFCLICDELMCSLLNELHEENQRLIKMLDNIAIYEQKQHKDMSFDDFVEWWDNIVREGL